MGIVGNLLDTSTSAQSRFSRRNIELFILIVAALPSFLLFALGAADTGQEITFATFNYPIAIAIAFIIAHVVMRIWAPGADPAILPLTYVLVNIGMAFLWRLAPDVMAIDLAAGVEPEDLSFTPDDVYKQLIFIFAAVACLVVIVVLTRKRFKMDRLSQYSYLFMGIAIVLLALPLIPFLNGGGSHGALGWIHIAGFTMQPSEFAKLFMVMGLASYMAANRERLSIFTVRKGPFKLPDIKTLAPLLAMWLIAMAIIAVERDFGTAFVLFAIFLAMLYVATGKKFYAIIGIVLVVGGIAMLSPFFEHIQVRIENWLNPFADPQNTGYQMVQSLYSMADGNIFGTGIGNGLCFYIPEVETDCIFSAIAEETGLFGAACVLLIYLSFAIRGFLVAARAKSDFACLVAVGMTSIIVLQAFIIVAGLTRVIPLTGITLPFVCKGGSSILASFMALAFLARCGDEGTGVQTKMITIFDQMDKKGVLGRYALGKRLTHTIVILAAMYIVLVGALISIMFIHAAEYRDMPANNHTMIHQATVQRGTISTSDGVVLAESIETDDDPYSNYKRTYPAGDLASQVVGYSSRRYGTTGIENACNSYLAGTQGNSFFGTAVDLLGNETAGNNVTLTIDSHVQRAAQDALEGYTGACVVMDAHSGAILAMASSPTYDASNFEAVLQAANEGSSDSSMVNRAIQSRYAPGSTFKTVTLTSALENEVADANTLYNAPGEMDVAGRSVVNYEHEELGTVTLAQAYAYSSNTAFAQLALQLGGENLANTAYNFGFDSEIPFDLDVLTSRMAKSDEMDEWELAWAAAGQPVGKSTANGPYATVLQMALTGAAIANDGTIMKPYIVDGVYSPEGIRTYAVIPTVFSRACSPATASEVERMMTGVVEYGTGRAAAIDGYHVYGKTGTAETGQGADDSWFVGCVDYKGGTVVVAMVLEQASTHGDGMSAAAHCKPVLEAAIACE